MEAEPDFSSSSQGMVVPFRGGEEGAAHRSVPEVGEKSKKWFEFLVQSFFLRIKRIKQKHTVLSILKFLILP